MRKKLGKLIVIEGGDGSGKTMQTNLLLKRFSGQITKFDFPRYRTSFAGALVGECLAGKHGDFLKLSPYLASLPYTIDRIGAKPELERALAVGNVVCNRYTPSNVAHQGAKLWGGRQKSLAPFERFIAFIEDLEYGELQIPKPDCVIFLNMPVGIAFELIARKQKREHLEKRRSGRDVHESDKEYLEKVAGVYSKLAESREDWHIVQCSSRTRNVRAPEDIHDDVWRIVAPLVS